VGKHIKLETNIFAKCGERWDGKSLREEDYYWRPLGLSSRSLLRGKGNEKFSGKGVSEK